MFRLILLILISFRPITKFFFSPSNFFVIFIVYIQNKHDKTIAMSKNESNPITSGQSGKFDRISFQKNSVMRKLPDTSNRTWSPLQVRHHEHFENAKEYGRHVVADAQKSAYYKALLPKWKKKRRISNVGVYQIAVCDFSHPPVIKKVELMRAWDTSLFSILIYPLDNFKVEGVFVSILTSDGKLIEEGGAVMHKYMNQYEYGIKYQDRLIPGNISRIRVWDVPGNITEKYFSFIVENNLVSLYSL